MRTAIILIIGFALWGVCLGVARFLVRGQQAYKTATLTFIALWFLAAAANLYVGVAHAGYSLGEEIPIFLLIFLPPAVVAVVVYGLFLSPRKNTHGQGQT